MIAGEFLLFFRQDIVGVITEQFKNIGTPNVQRDTTVVTFCFNPWTIGPFQKLVNFKREEFSHRGQRVPSRVNATEQR